MDDVIAESKPFRITRLELARTGAIQYLKSFWFILIGIPIAGIFLLIFMPNSFGKAFGTLFVLWPLTIPGRMAAVSWQKGNDLLQPTVAAVTSEEVLLRPTNGNKGTRVPNDWIRKVWTYADLIVIEGYRYQFVMLRKSAFPLENQEQAWAALRAKAQFSAPEKAKKA